MAYILGIETSCDETAASVTENGRKVLSNVVYSQIPLHTIYGGVVPEIASRKHIDKIIHVIDRALKEANIEKEQLDAVAVTYNPGLVGALLVGVSVAKAFAYSIKKPLVPVNHIQGHIAANYIAYPELEPPFVSLVASGGHSHILHIKDYRSFDVIGATTDDAAGEAFDKAARVLGLGYPGGPKLNALAKEGNPEAIRFPRPHNGYDFSFSGLKTAVINYVHTAEQKGEEINKADGAAAFQQAVCDVLVNNTVAAAKELKVDKIAIAGGVAANTLLREQMEREGKKAGLQF
ncbi:MAG: tRNA (adenosine(37)-N6)-threonylcarbamoyltransferase complex transferase subunit TsaD [Clostridia bacterium]|nr:tRNA (adenosine(37)-N6)-threonylcarbamoyltransferase complex transferase subunit TsaD [Clostridia bacterium]